MYQYFDIRIVNINEMNRTYTITFLWRLVLSSYFTFSVQQQQPFYSHLSRTTRVSRYQKKHSPTHHPDHHPMFMSFFYLPRFIPSSLFKLRAWQSFCTTSFHVLFGLPLYLLVWSLHLIFHTFLHPISVFFSQHMLLWLGIPTSSQWAFSA